MLITFELYRGSYEELRFRYIVDGSINFDAEMYVFPEHGENEEIVLRRELEKRIHIRHKLNIIIAQEFQSLYYELVSQDI